MLRGMSQGLQRLLPGRILAKQARNRSGGGDVTQSLNLRRRIGDPYCTGPVR